MDWGFAFKVAGIGFGGVFSVLIILALTLWLVGIGIRRASEKSAKAQKDEGKE